MEICRGERWGHPGRLLGEGLCTQHGWSTKQGCLGLRGAERRVGKVTLSPRFSCQDVRTSSLRPQGPLGAFLQDRSRCPTEARVKEESDRNSGSKMENARGPRPPVFPDGNTEFLRRKVAGPRSHSWREKGPEPGLPTSDPSFVSVRPRSSPIPSPDLGQARPLAASLSWGRAPIPHVHTATLSQEARNKFFFSGNALLPSLQNNVFIIAKPFPSLRRKCIPHDSPKRSGPGLQIQYVNSFVNIYSG